MSKNAQSIINQLQADNGETTVWSCLMLIYITYNSYATLKLLFYPPIKHREKKNTLTSQTAEPQHKKY